MWKELHLRISEIRFLIDITKILWNHIQMLLMVNMAKWIFLDKSMYVDGLIIWDSSTKCNKKVEKRRNRKERLGMVWWGKRLHWKLGDLHLHLWKKKPGMTALACNPCSGWQKQADPKSSLASQAKPKCWIQGDALSVIRQRAVKDTKYSAVWKYHIQRYTETHTNTHRGNRTLPSWDTTSAHS